MLEPSLGVRCALYQRCLKARHVRSRYKGGLGNIVDHFHLGDFTSRYNGAAYSYAGDVAGGSTLFARGEPAA
ncbi:MAG: hypothetical protein ACM3VU_00280 [Arthrospira platensis]